MTSCWLKAIYKPHLSICLIPLLPFSWLYAVLMWARRRLYLKRQHPDALTTPPVVVVGNLTLGGSGKTPIVAFLTWVLQEKGYRVGIVSRGYPHDHRLPRLVQSNDKAEEIGDEPVMLFDKTKAPVVVCKDRQSAVEFLIKHHTVEVILSDDGLQHVGMPRAMECLIIDGSVGFGNQRVLPAGPLREGLGRLSDVDFVLAQGRSVDDVEATLFRLVPTVVKPLRGWATPCPIRQTPFKKVHAVAGIARPQRFFEMLKTYGFEVIEHAFPDHHHFIEADFKDFSDETILMTEKDAVKCKEFVLRQAWVVQVRCDISAEFVDQFMTRLEPFLHAPGQKVT